MYLAHFDKYRHVLTNSNLEEKLNQTTNIDHNTKEVTETIIYAADQAIPNKYDTKGHQSTLGSLAIL